MMEVPGGRSLPAKAALATLPCLSILFVLVTFEFS